MGFIWKTTQGKSILEYDGKTILTIPAAEVRRIPLNRWRKALGAGYPSLRNAKGRNENGVMP